jgi:hypothetical protein
METYNMLPLSNAFAVVADNLVGRKQFVSPGKFTPVSN